ncbi:MAG TPA: DMT family transporter [Gemmatimonadales bacterium]|nr:DMT family transporter [Gemmatimonadales bacterium]
MRSGWNRYHGCTDRQICQDIFYCRAGQQQTRPRFAAGGGGRRKNRTGGPLGFGQPAHGVRLRLQVHLALVLVQVLFASLAIAGRYVLREFPAGGLLLVRVVGGAAVLTAVLALRGGPWVTDRRDQLRLLGLGLLGIAANQGLFIYGLRHTTAINATILVTTVPVFTVLGSVLAGREPPSPLKFLGIGIAAAGTVYLIGPDRISLAPQAALGNALIVLGMLCYAAYFIGARAVLSRYDSLTVSAHVMAFAIVGVLPVGLAAMRRVDFGAVGDATWGWVAYIVLFPTICTYLLNIWALRRVSHNVVAVYIYLQPIVAALVAPHLLAGEAVTPRAAAAGLAIFTGLALVLWAEHRQRIEVTVEAVGE